MIRGIGGRLYVVDEQRDCWTPYVPPDVTPWAADDLAAWLAGHSEPVISMQEHMALLEVAIHHASARIEAENRNG